MKAALIILASSFLFTPSTPAKDQPKARAINVCTKHGGLFEIAPDPYTTTYMCNTGIKFQFTTI
jgi:hypothetical protein